MKKTYHPAYLMFFTACLLFQSAKGQNIRNDTIALSTDAVVEIVFPSEPDAKLPNGDGSYEVSGGGKKKSLILRALRTDAKEQPLLITEGNRRHEFILMYKAKAPSAQLDWSSSKKLKAHVKEKEERAGKELARANQLYKENSLEPALAKYRWVLNEINEADKAFVSSQIADIEKQLQDRYQKNYNEAMSKARALDGTNSAEARKYYAEALKYKPGDQEAFGRMAAIDQGLYKEHIKKAESAYQSKDFVQAKANYEEARKINPRDFQYHRKIYDNVVVQAKEQLFQLQKKKADAAFERRDLEGASRGYDSALLIKPGDVQSLSKKKQVIKEQEALVQNRKKEAEYYAVLSRAKALAAFASNEKEYNLAIEEYKKASRIFPKRRFPADKMNQLIQLKKSSSRKR